jgi:hypothetical protein
MPDRLEACGGRLCVLRERYGITAVDTSTMAIAWSQAMFQAAREENIRLLARVAPELTRALEGKAGDDSAPPPYLNLGQRASSTQWRYQQLDQSAQNLTRTGPNLGTSERALAASQQIQRDMAAATTALAVMNAAADISNAFWAAVGESISRNLRLANSRNATLGLRLADEQYQRALSGRYFVPAPTEVVTLVDLATGKRADVMATLDLPGVSGKIWSLALSPDGRRLAVAGIAVDAKRYRPIARSLLEVPASSLVVYDTPTMDFRDRMNPAIAQVAGKVDPLMTPSPDAAVSGGGAQGTAAVDPAYLITAGYPKLVAYALAGRMEEVQAALKAGQDVNAPYAVLGLTPLMAAVSRGDVAMVRLLLDSGADARPRNALGKTALDLVERLKDPTIREEIKKLLGAAAEAPKP